MLIGNDISYPSLSCLYRPSSLQTNLTAPQPLLFLSVRPSTYLPVLPSFPGSADSQLLLSVHLSVRPSSCLSCPGSVDRSSVSCRRSVLLRHGHWSDSCTLSADGQATIFAHFSLKFSFPSKVYFTHFPHLLQLSISLSVICLHLHPPP